MFERYDWYIGGPMRGYPDLNYPLFNMVAKKLTNMSYSVFNPAEYDGGITLGQDKGVFAFCMRRDLNAVINECKGIILLPEWEKSLGANIEAFVAFACGKTTVMTDNLSINNDEVNFDIVSIDLTNYSLPYLKEGGRQFNPHECSLDSFGG